MKRGTFRKQSIEEINDKRLAKRLKDKDKPLSPFHTKKRPTVAKYPNKRLSRAISMTSPIPKQMRDEMSEDNFMKSCCLAEFGRCSGKIEWHHNLRFEGKRVNEPFCILPACKYHHSKADNRETKEKFDHVMWNRATEEQIKYYSVAEDYKHRKDYLNGIYG